jgi:hypothetical protein
LEQGDLDVFARHCSSTAVVALPIRSPDPVIGSETVPGLSAMQGNEPQPVLAC